jgi:hypothetical protein
MRSRDRRYGYVVRRGRIHIRDARTGVTTFQGRPLERAVVKALPAGNSDDIIVLLDASEISDPVRNLLRVNPFGEIQWEAELPPPRNGADSYLTASMSEDGLWARSWSGYKAKIDLATGAVQSLEFVK